ncbi:phosphate signaling complex protein PhoU [Sphingomonas quercus]|uniref:Phosphate-specific transport system accessory protein PhoU n=1 Tax=Sphingomonas quercus TaxID=2842451 RepID=A0ABS6BF72_9SPHN|nr:phosphate signaling complex protein PhoU [Sphingomonas quercus]MBU3076482.1 phosphate signaling complex protein PhoU [Sphingomonas quercus]
MASSGHTVKAFDEDLTDLRGLVSEMGGLAEQAISASLQALVNRDLDGAARIVESDKRVDEIEAEIELQVVRLIALRAPMADDLRDVLAALKIANIIERIADYAKNIAKRVPIVSETQAIEPLSILPAMGRLAAEMVRDALDAFAARDAEAAVAVCGRDRAVDDFYNSLFRTLLTYMMENPHNISPSTHLLFIAKNLERIGDHATNVAEMVYFAATGRQMAERPRGEDAFGQLDDLDEKGGTR